MLVIHAGMPKTGTTSLQRALAGAQDALREHGVAYPAAFRNAENIAHHQLPADLLSPDAARGQAFLDYLAEESAPVVLVSSEAFINLFSRRSIFGFVCFLEACCRLRPVRIVVVLRRIDSFMQSMYLHSVKTGETDLVVADYLEQRVRWADGLFGCLTVPPRTLPHCQVQFQKYERANDYVPRLLERLALDANARSVVPPAGESGARLGLKAQTLLFHLDAVGERVGATIERRPLLRRIDAGEFRFDDDIDDYTVFDPFQARWLHETALRAAYELSLSDYVGYFGQDRPATAAASSLDLGNLEADDFERIRSYVDQCHERRSS